MIHKAQVFVSLPGLQWVLKKRIQRANTLLPSGNDPKGAILCEKGSVKIWSSSGTPVDQDSELEYEFVMYDEKTRRVIIAAFVGEGDEGAPVSFDNLFTTKTEELFQMDRAFLIVPVARGVGRVEAWALAPTGEDAHDEYGASAGLGYLARLLWEARK